ncbi:MAG: glutaminase A [Cyanobacteria bacterium]|nr:glutaminase A [Cyanobacteriota bacterium]MDW8202121.1 glutaminase A [Cyanobacteriota bacterium SKYGB_h_bin112]
MTNLATLTPTQLRAWTAKIQQHLQTGQQPNYIPRLLEANLTDLVVAVRCLEGATYVVGNAQTRFVLMSVVKPFVLLYLLEHFGKAKVFQRVGLDPSGEPFNSLQQLQADRGFPRNPMINSGALVLASMLPGNSALERCNRFCDWLNQTANSNYVLDEAMVMSVRQGGSKQNRALTSLLAQAGYVDDEEVTLDTYNHVCCLSGTVIDLVNLGLLLAGKPGVVMTNRQIVNALMLTCGLYEMSGRYAVRVGLPAKSGVSGALLAVVPREGAIASYSPALDAVGNPIAGMLLLEKLSQSLSLSIF